MLPINIAPVGGTARPAGKPAALSLILQPPQVLLDRRIQAPRLLDLPAPLGGQPLHLLLERLAVVLDLLGADVAAGRQDVAVLADLLQRGAPCRSRGRPRTRPRPSSPRQAW